MKNFTIFTMCLFFSISSFAFQLPTNAQGVDKNTKGPYFQQEVNTIIDVTLDDVKHTLTGNIEIEYINNSPDVLNEIFMHLWANAYKDRTTAFANQQLRNKSTKFHYADLEDRGNFSGIEFTIDGQVVSFSEYENNRDIVRIKLPFGLEPNKKITIKTPLNLKIPASFSRLGHVGESYQMTQWFPKPAVYDRDGWHPMPYLTQGEFYSEFGSYDVSITLPENYIVCATGELQNQSEIAFLEEKIAETKARANDTIPDLSFPPSSEKMKTIRYLAENVHDFGWFADKRFYVEKGNVTLSNGNGVDTWVFYTDTEKDLWKDALSYVDRSVKFYSEKVGNYPYPHATAVQSALSAGGGMEYPMITVIGAMGQAQALDGVITHEVGHNWFYGILGFNERDHPWLDEGINSYYDHRYDQQYYPTPMNLGLPPRLTKNLDISQMQMALRMQMKRGHDQAPSLHSADFESTNYFFSCYEKPAIAFEFLEEYLGAERFDAIMQSLYKEWEFKHPGPDEVISHFNEEAGEDLSWFFDGFIYSTDEMDYKLADVKKEADKYVLKVSNKGEIASPYPITAYKKNQAVHTEWYEPIEGTSKVDFPIGDYDYFVIDSSYTMLDFNMDNNYKKEKGARGPKIGIFTDWDRKDKSQYFVTPVLATNKHDGIMLGLNLHNLSIPFPKFKGSITTMYGFKSNKLVGVARLQYDQPIRKGSLQRVTYGLLSKQFSLQNSTTIDGEIKRDYGTIVPWVNLHFVHGPGSNVHSDLELKSTFVRYTNKGDETTTNDEFYVKASYKLQNQNVLYPSAAKLGVEYLDYTTVLNSKENTVKLDLELIQRFEYMKGRKFGIRAYGAFFPVTPSVGYASLNSYGPSNKNINLVHNSQADYAFEDYYFNRGNNSINSMNQVHMRGGAFKVANISASNIGQSDRAAFAVNLVSDFPIKRIPKQFKLYFDYGGYMINRSTSEERKWETIYSGGVMLNLFNAINMYVPIVNSDNILADNPKFFQRITFTLDLNKLNIMDLYNTYRI